MAEGQTILPGDRIPYEKQTKPKQKKQTWFILGLTQETQFGEPDDSVHIPEGLGKTWIRVLYPCW